MIAKTGEIPHQVSIQREGHHHCGGSIIDEYHILTAAHCVVEEDGQQTQGLKVLSRTINSVTGMNGQLRDIKLVISHKHFNYSRYENDIAILLLDVPISFDENQNIIKFSGASFDMKLKPGDIVIASGWGETENKQLSELLKTVKTHVISNDKCLQLDPRTKSRNFICTHSPHRNCGVSFVSFILRLKYLFKIILLIRILYLFVTQGDSGGPLVYEGVLVGIAARSWCNGIAPDIFTRISKYNEWIYQVLAAFPN
ncbi:chymotrypsin-2-like [Aphidius gifuensis]|nr:chymotrypsin-2-like [Aphidius gifuensis]